MKELYEMGLTPNEINKLLNVPASSTMNWVNKFGWQRLALSSEELENLEDTLAQMYLSQENRPNQRVGVRTAKETTQRFRRAMKLSAQERKYQRYQDQALSMKERVAAQLAQELSVEDQLLSQLGLIEVRTHDLLTQKVRLTKQADQNPLTDEEELYVEQVDKDTGMLTLKRTEKTKASLLDSHLKIEEALGKLAGEKTRILSELHKLRTQNVGSGEAGVQIVVDVPIPDYLLNLQKEKLDGS